MFSGCASIINGSRQDVTITSRPNAADVKITKSKSGKVVFQGLTPCKARLNRSSGPFMPASYLVEISAPGYSTKTVELKSRLSGWYFGNLFFGGLPGLLIIDPLTGGMWALSQEEVGVGLEPLEIKRRAKVEGPGMNVVMLKDVPSYLRQKMRPIASLTR